MIAVVKPGMSRSVVAIRLISQRQLSTSCSESVDKLLNILENYRVANYTREMPRRFRNEICKAACAKSSPLLSSASSPAKASPSGVVSADGIEYVLNNIGAGDSMPRSEIEMILREVGTVDPNEQEQYVISMEQMLDLISTNSRSI